MNNFAPQQILVTLLVVVAAFGIKVAMNYWVKRNKSRSDEFEKRHLLNTSKNLVNLLLVIALFVIWHEELQKFALSIAAFIVAIVLATKEVIQCIVGFGYISSTTPFRIGDWIQTGSYTGEVVETDWAKVTLLEVDTASYSYTGRSVFLPNSQMLTQPIKNLNFMRRYVNHSFSVVREDAGVNPFVFKDDIMAEATRLCADFATVAGRYNTLIENRLDAKLAGPEPSVNFTSTDLGKTRATFSIFCPTESAIEIEQQLIAFYLTLWYKAKKAAKESKENDKEES
ncbi:mechanosensitive ion channel protein MscS [Saccharobesus litoralis]|uniref:Mechanosensitive ion channel protein MscS n=1 Tax=Saccharobesus litoralis TaxID=2172099 RepID=A0A2S0VLX1_9ALTE|nr:mechanosensitive ion channel family protein [Saccharobesus litoralis]AWB65110.1 mechanosensitive ion channel protein MscS [Saccharobesus litoralis]